MADPGRLGRRRGGTGSGGRSRRAADRDRLSAFRCIVWIRRLYLQSETRSWTRRASRGFLCHGNREPGERTPVMRLHHPRHQPVELLHQRAVVRCPGARGEVGGRPDARRVLAVRRAGLLHAPAGLRRPHRFGHSCAAVCVVSAAGTAQRRQRAAVRAGRCTACRGDRCSRNGISIRVDARIRPLHHARLCTCPSTTGSHTLPSTSSGFVTGRPASPGSLRPPARFTSTMSRIRQPPPRR